SSPITFFASSVTFTLGIFFIWNFYLTVICVSNFTTPFVFAQVGGKRGADFFIFKPAVLCIFNTNRLTSWLTGRKIPEIPYETHAPHSNRTDC
ncbi:MAG: hypothetical protein M3367_04000, partial [Acidobacteriota bacterium]|nr:hypothetical protein [Acidobacteriota bacterium]